MRMPDMKTYSVTVIIEQWDDKEPNARQKMIN